MVPDGGAIGGWIACLGFGLTACAVAAYPLTALPKAQANAPQREERASADQRGTENLPLTVKLATSPEADKIARRAADDAHQQARDNENLVVITEVLAVLAAFQWAAMLWQGRSISRQVRLAREEFIASHRPIIRVRNIVANRVGSEDIPGHFQVIKMSERVSGEFEVANVGSTNATLEGVHLTFYAAKWRLPMRLPYEGKPSNCIFIENVAAGESIKIPFEIAVDTDGLMPDEAFNPSVTGSLVLYAMGWLTYRDREHVLRRTAFCRGYDKVAHRFSILVQDRDYESED